MNQLPSALIETILQKDRQLQTCISWEMEAPSPKRSEEVSYHRDYYSPLLAFAFHIKFILTVTASLEYYNHNLWKNL